MLIGTSDGNTYEGPVHQALGIDTNYAENNPKGNSEDLIAYDDSKSPENNWNDLSPQDKENTQNGWNYNPGNLVPYGDIKKEAPGGMFFSPDYQHQDYIERLKNEHDYEHYKDEKGNQFLMPKPKAPLVGQEDDLVGTQYAQNLRGSISDAPMGRTEVDPFQRAADRTKQSVKPEGGRQEGLLTKIPEAMSLDIFGKGLNSIGDIPSFINDMMERQPGQDFSEKEAGRAFNIATLLSGQPGTAGNAELNMGLKLSGKSVGKVNLVKKQEFDSLGHWEPGQPDLEGYKKFQIRDEENKLFGNLETTYNHENKNINIEWIGHGTGRQTPDKFIQSLGPARVRSLISQLKNEYPEAKSITGYRISGSRAKAGKEGEARLNLENRP